MTTDDDRVGERTHPAIVETAGGSSTPPPPERSVALQLIGSVIVPGAPTLRRSVALGIVLMSFGCVLPVALLTWAYLHRDDLIGFSLDQSLLTTVVVVVIASVIARAIAVAEVAHNFWGTPDIRIKTAIAGIAVVALAVPSIWVAYQANQTRQVVGEVFSSGDADPLFQPDASERFRPDPLVPETAATGETMVDETGFDEEAIGTDGPVGVTTAPNTDADPDQDAGTATDAGTGSGVDTGDDPDPGTVRTTLLLGGDAGPGRWGMRTDTMMLFSVHEASGRTALVSIPRNLTRLHFPPETPLAKIFPNGFNGLTNAIFTYVSTRDELVEAYSESGQRPEVVALAQGIGYSLDVQIDDFVLVNMQGFLDIVDAVGGVRIEVPKRVLLQIENPVGDYDPPESVGPGMVDMDGTLAIAYVRARRGDSDYHRMERQRQMLAALGSQVSTREAIAAFVTVTRVLGDSMRTSLSAGEFSDLLDQFDENASIGESVGLTPPLITPGRPDYANIQSIIDAVEHYVRTGEPSGFAG